MEKEGTVDRTPRLTIVIVNYNTCNWLNNCLQSVCRQRVVRQIEVVIVDNASSDGSVEMVREQFPQFDLVPLPTNAGFSRSNNIGAGRGTAPLLLFLNPDTELFDGSLEAMLAYLETNPHCDIAGGKIYDGLGDIERSSGSWPTLTSRMLDRLLDYAPFPIVNALEHRAHRNRIFDSCREVDWVTGAYLWIRRSTFERHRGFDPEFFYYDDVDLCRRVRGAGGSVWYLPVAPLIHYKNKAPVSSHRRKEAQVRSLRLFKNKHLRS